MKLKEIKRLVVITGKTFEPEHEEMHLTMDSKENLVETFDHIPEMYSLHFLEANGFPRRHGVEKSVYDSTQIGDRFEFTEGVWVQEETTNS